MNSKYLICVLGPTAIGKTSLSIKLAQAYQTHIISADSRQFFREMYIGTAAPEPVELKAAPHHFIHHKSIEEAYSVGDFQREALEKIDQLFKDHSILILAGGSGLYVKSILEGLDDFPDVDPSIRQDLNNIHAQQGLLPLQEKLRGLDPATYSRIDIENPHRVIRALEICIGTGKPYSSYLQKGRLSRNFSVIKIGLTAPREEIYSRINQRVDLMVEAGLPEEAGKLLPYKHLNALNTVGYKEMFAYLEGEYTLEQAVEEIKKNTRRFAKRQLTWFRKEEDIHWFPHNSPLEDILKFINNRISGQGQEGV